MPDHDFGPIFAHIPAVIDDMADVFSSHELINRLMQRQQGLFVLALHAFKDETPFRKVNNRISKELRNHTEKIIYVGRRNSPNVFGDVNPCAYWQKVNVAIAGPPEEEG